jgi:hypothetical protein
VVTLFVLLLAQGGPESVDADIRRLGDDDWAERDAAEERLAERVADLTDGIFFLRHDHWSRDPDARLRGDRLRAACRALFGSLPGPTDADAAWAGCEDAASPEDVEIRRRLRSIRISVDLQNAPLTSVIEYVRELSGLNFLIDSQAAADDAVLSVRAMDVPVEGFLQTALRPLSCVHAVSGGVVTVTSASSLERRVKLELYDIQDLVRSEEGEGFARHIRESVLEAEWSAAEDRAIEFNTGLLIVRNTPRVHAALRRYLAGLRGAAAIEEGRPEIAGWFARLCRGTPEERDEAERRVAALLRDGERVQSALVRALDSRDAEIRCRAERLLGRLVRAPAEELRRR